MIENKLKIKRRVGNGAESSAAKSCPDFFELENGDFAIIGYDKTEELRNGLPGDASCLDSERIVVVPRNIIISAIRDIS